MLPLHLLKACMDPNLQIPTTEEMQEKAEELILSKEKRIDLISSHVLSSIEGASSELNQFFGDVLPLVQENPNEVFQDSLEPLKTHLAFLKKHRQELQGSLETMQTHCQQKSEYNQQLQAKVTELTHAERKKEPAATTILRQCKPKIASYAANQGSGQKN